MTDLQPHLPNCSYCHMPVIGKFPVDTLAYGLGPLHFCDPNADGASSCMEYYADGLRDAADRLIAESKNVRERTARYV